jgi:hypothetical protein
MNLSSMKCSQFFSIWILSIVVFSCNTSPEKANEVSTPPTKLDTLDTVPKALEFNKPLCEYAEVLAGTDSVLYSNNETYKRYKESADEAYSTFYNAKIVPFAQWSQAHIDTASVGATRIFYPFSGPDIVYAYSLFPDATEYNLFGLEPLGRIPQWTVSERDSMLENLASIQHALSDQMRFSFFVTTHMSDDLSKQKADGVLPILLFYMTRLQLKIQSLQPIEIADDGTLKPSTSGKAKGLQFKCFKEGDNILKTVNYFSVDISNPGYGKCPGLEKLILSFDNSATLVKSASYCLHEDKYSIIRSHVLQVSQSIVQDDTGIPFRYLNTQDWTNKVFGIYTSPINVFKQFYQSDYHSAFKEQSTPINFRFGYSDPSNILVAVHN